ncbi:AIPR family protein [Tenacibaculum maritimum]|uniref:AIPR family protein n=1 Tax=Tenacibaculum maritimum TaxID=107401 RepID=UPI0012E6E94C|nr:AIPR family protein [Tenacibaculum maritimum]CAA0148179.1 Abortive phage resistance protein [Tenacibaculum maritimum]CAA0159408.1 Abortive phage resistance protein [Tenacibaculum maritimum]
MANINDYKLLAKKSEKYFTLLASELEESFPNIETKDRERIGFYLFMIENLCNIKDTLDLANVVTDTEFNSKIFNDKFDDYGIDAVYIDEENLSINLFNFKYRNKFNPAKKQSINEAIISTKFINALLNENVNNLAGKLKTQANNIIEKFNSSDVWKFNLFVVSNENIELQKTDDDLKQLEDMYSLEVIPIGLSQISKIMSIRPEPIDSEIIIEQQAIMSYSESSISSSKSYVLRLPLSEIVRITCNDKTLRRKYNIEDLKELSKIELDYSVLFDNVRGLVLRSKFNKNISKTLKEEPSKFFMYNNGLTITAKDIEATPVNANKRVKLSIKSFQVLNGGQTLRTIHSFNKLDETNIEEYLAKSEVLVRIFKTTQDNELNNKIAEFTNSQNSISNIDLKSLRTEQIQLEQFLDENDIIYSRKSGDTGLSGTKVYKHKISMERFGQVIFSINGNPHRASNQKKQIFDKYYDELFGESALKIEQSPEQVSKYYEIKKKYDSKNEYESSDQKIFYILYLNQHISKDIDSLIDLFEDTIKAFVPSNSTISDSRKLIQLKFKDYLDEQLKIKN